ncbi:hypothetical protein [Arthrobacter sp. MYb227]|uniref:hypothetical protein n=1 Tax=Arthrobacter sp. MYb227 TaxID=1848601 RepID=UPI002157188E|nr:hypothetical protein [Arthrobacter sp. MYb227]
MSQYTLSTASEIILSLYNSVGWTAYTKSPEVLIRAIRSSAFVVSAWTEEGQLVGLARTISDDATICYF